MDILLDRVRLRQSTLLPEALEIHEWYSCPNRFEGLTDFDFLNISRELGKKGRAFFAALAIEGDLHEPIVMLDGYLKALCLDTRQLALDLSGATRRWPVRHQDPLARFAMEIRRGADVWSPMHNSVRIASFYERFEQTGDLLELQKQCRSIKRLVELAKQEISINRLVAKSLQYLCHYMVQSVLRANEGKLSEDVETELTSLEERLIDYLKPLGLYYPSGVLPEHEGYQAEVEARQLEQQRIKQAEVLKRNQAKVVDANDARALKEAREDQSSGRSTHEERETLEAKTPSTSNPSKTNTTSATVVDQAKEFLNLFCADADGTPACGIPFMTTLVDGSVRQGELDHQGKYRLEGLPAGPVQVTFGDPVEDAEIQQTRDDLKATLDAIIAEEQQEAARIEAEHSQRNFISRYFAYRNAMNRGIRNAIGGFFSFLKETSDLINPLVYLRNSMRSAWGAYKHSDDEGFRKKFIELMDEETFREITDVLGVDPRTITREKIAEAQELLNFIWEDEESKDMLLSFAWQYIKAQHDLERMEAAGGFAGELAIDIVITALTVGLGASVVVASKARYMERFKSLGDTLLHLGRQLKQKAKFQKRKANTGDTVEMKLDKPVHQDVEGVEVPVTSKNEADSIGDSLNGDGASRDGTSDAGADSPTSKGKTDFSGRKGIPPKSLDDAVNRLETMREDIIKNGHVDKYTDAELVALAAANTVPNERFQTRFMGADYLVDKWNSPDVPYSGKLGGPFKSETNGDGIKYWSTSFDQLEDADTDAKLLAEKLGVTNYDPNETYAFVIIDNEKLSGLTGAKSITPTFENISDFAAAELPSKYSREKLDDLYNPDFQAKYKKVVDEFNARGLKHWKESDVIEMTDFISSQGMSVSDFETRSSLQGDIGSNEDFLGNGLTKNNVESTANEYGAVETLTFENNSKTFAELKDLEAVKILILKPEKGVN